MKGAFSRSVCAGKQRIGHPVADQGFSSSRLSTMPEMDPYKVKQTFSRPVCVGKQKNIPHPAATAAMHCHPECNTHPPPPCPTFLLAHNLSSKLIVQTGNVWQNLDDNIVVKGLSTCLAPTITVVLMC